MTVQRIASLLASGTEMVCGLGLADRLVAISHECDFPESVLSLPRATGTRVDAAISSKAIDDVVRQMSVERTSQYDVDDQLLAKLRPDIIITQAQCDVCAVRYEDVVTAVARHPELAAAEIVALNPQTFDDIFRDIAAVATACGAAHAGEAYLASLRSRVETVRGNARQRALSSEADPPKVACIEWMDPLMISGNWLPEMIELAGGEPLLGVAGQHSGYVAWERIRDARPDAILIIPCGFDLERTMSEIDVLTNLPGWNETPAAQTGRIHAVDGNAYFNRSGPRMVDSLQILAGLIHSGDDLPISPGVCRRVQ